MSRSKHIWKVRHAWRRNVCIVCTALTSVSRKSASQPPDSARGGGCGVDRAATAVLMSSTWTEEPRQISRHSLPWVPFFINIAIALEYMLQQPVTCELLDWKDLSSEPGKRWMICGEKDWAKKTLPLKNNNSNRKLCSPKEDCGVSSIIHCSERGKRLMNAGEKDGAEKNPAENYSPKGDCGTSSTVHSSECGKRSMITGEKDGAEKNNKKTTH